MHELSIAMNIVEIAEKCAEKANAGKINEIEIEVGTLSGVVVEALEFALEVAVRNTTCECAQRIIRHIPARGRCLACSREFDIDSFIAQCPECGQFNVDLLQGQELRVKSITVD
jgi:hydrogenase nickel incorporation protein HypA/HybF